MSKMVEFEASNLFDEPRWYKIKLMDCETGLRLWHEHFASIMDAFTKLDGDDIFSLGYIVASSFKWDFLKDMAKTLLAFAEITIDGTAHKLDSNGLGSLFEGNPKEFYTSLFNAAKQNYAPLLSQLKKQSEKKKEEQAAQ